MGVGTIVPTREVSRGSHTGTGRPRSGQGGSGGAHTRRKPGKGLPDAAVAVALTSARIAVGIGVILAARSIWSTGPFVSRSSHPAWEASLLRWDSNFYLQIAHSGYQTMAEHAFLPLYPLLIRAVSPVFGYEGGALAVSWVSAALAVWGIIDVTRRFASPMTARLVGALFLWNPVSVFLFAAYPESLLVALMAWSLRFALDGRWWWAALLAGAASATLPQGFASGVVVLVAVLLGARSVIGALRAIGWALLGEAGIIAYVIYCGLATGNPLILRTADIRGWGGHPTYPFHSVVMELSRAASWHFVQNGVDVSTQMRAVFAIDAVAGIVGGVVTILAIALCFRHRELLLPTLLLAVGMFLSVTTIDTFSDATARFVFGLAPLYVLTGVMLGRMRTMARRLAGSGLLLTSVWLSLVTGVWFGIGYWLT